MEKNNDLFISIDKDSQVSKTAQTQKLHNQRMKILKNKNAKTVSVLLPLDLIERIKHYQNTEARRFETQSYIFTHALNAWLDNKMTKPKERI